MPTAQETAAGIFTDDSFNAMLGGILGGAFGLGTTAMNNKTAENIANTNAGYVPPGGVSSAGSGTSDNSGLTALLAGLLGQQNRTESGGTPNNMLLYIIVGVVALALVGLFIWLAVRKK